MRYYRKGFNGFFFVSPAPLRAVKAHKKSKLILNKLLWEIGSSRPEAIPDIRRAERAGGIHDVGIQKQLIPGNPIENAQPGARSAPGILTILGSPKRLEPGNP
jgi:hypothetical protein